MKKGKAITSLCEEKPSREFKEARIKDGYLVDPMFKHVCERPAVQNRRWRKEMEEYET